MIIKDLAKDIFYIEDAFPSSQMFIEKIEHINTNNLTNSIIPGWSKWVDGYPVKRKIDDHESWEQFYPDTEDQHRGQSMLFDWDLTINDQNNFWPRKSVDKNFDTEHKESYEIIKLIEEDYIKVLNIWSEKTNNNFPKYVTKNYCIRKYRTGGAMGSHVDRNADNLINTMDWTALIYLNDDYEGGELVFDELNLSIKPKAGSVIFFPCMTYHSVCEIKKGNKYYIFLFMHTNSGISTSLGEPYHALESKINAVNRAQT
jgi:hypothetical protein